MDPLAPGHLGRYDDGRVAVSRLRDQGVIAHYFASRPPTAVTEHFRLYLFGSRVVVLHDLVLDDLDNDLAGLIATELFGPGLLQDPEDFARVFTGVVRSTAGDPLSAWLAFYENTLARLRDPDPGQGPIGEFAPIYRRVADLVAGTSVLDVGSCFGFLPLLLLEMPGRRVIASDREIGTVRLLTTVARERRTPLETLVADARALPLGDNTVDTVLCIHLLEHLSPRDGERVFAELVRVARRRVVVAVPYEDEPTAAFGHVRAFRAVDLARLATSTRLSWRVDDFHGGWLIADKDGGSAERHDALR
ncbi:class I SAM-dependent methyltransferase [Carbonactinospora thermoautotrophica]|nr:class I SAM-dependent methyltransferase [Carbonactinospora thermoautotrophica]